MNNIEFVTEYEYATFSLLMVLIGLYVSRRRFHSSANRLFVALMVYTSLSVVFHIITTKTLRIADQLPLWLNYAFNVGYLFFYDMIGIVYMVYVAAITRRNHIGKLEHILATSMMAVYVILLFSTPWSKMVIYFDQDMMYRHGPLFVVLPVMGAIVHIYAIVVLVKYGKNLKQSQRISILIFTGLTVLTTIIQLVRSEQIIANFGIALSLIMILISIENPADYIDPTTGCLNAEAFYITIEARLTRQKPFIVAAFRPEGLNYFVELLGVSKSGMACERIADKLRSELGNGELYYLGNWEFAIISTDRHERTKEELSELLIDFFRHPIVINGMEAAVTPCICTISYPGFIHTAEDVRDAIDYTLKTMKGHGAAVIEAAPEAIHQKQRELHILSAIKRCIMTDGFEMYYQPLYDVANGTFESAEALIRMPDTQLGYVSPEEFIPIAEENGLIIQIGELAFRSVCRFLNSGKAQRLGVKYIEVNLSVIQCLQEKLASNLIGIMNEFGIQPWQINFEITETAGLANYDILLKNMRQLIDHGVSFSMDDYGTGFSTANYLIALPTDIVKIDKSILWPAMESNEAFIILRHTVEMLKSLKKKIVVEGVETEKMVQVLSDIGCDYLQGFYYSKPVPAERYLEFLKKNNKQSDKIIQ